MFSIINLRNLRNSEFVQFINDLLAIVQKHDPPTIKIETPYQSLNESQATLSLIFNQKQGSAITEDISLADGRRDTAFVGISLAVNAYTYNFDEGVRLAAQLLSESLQKYTGTADLNYSAETSVLINLLTNWRSDSELISAIDTLGLRAWINELEVANTTFNDLFLARITESAESPTVKVKEVREEVLANYKTLLEHITAYATIDGVEAYSALVNEINTLVEVYDKILTTRQNKASVVNEE